MLQFSNGDLIPEVRSNEEWQQASRAGRPAWSYYRNNADTGKVFGRLYNWYAVNDPRGLSPKGWHIPSNNEWIELENYLGVTTAAVRMKNIEGWIENGNGDNSSGFTALPGGYRDRNGNFTGAGEFIYWQVPVMVNQQTPGEKPFHSFGVEEFNMQIILS